MAVFHTVLNMSFGHCHVPEKNTKKYRQSFGRVNPEMTEGVGEKLRCVIKCAFSIFHEVVLKR